MKIINDFFDKYELIGNLTNAFPRAFARENGKKILFENENSLYKQLKNYCDNNNLNFKLNREILVSQMRTNEIHDDIKKFFDKLQEIVKDNNNP